MLDLIPFHFDTHEVRVHVRPDGNPWWVLVDTCGVLDIQNVSDVVKRISADALDKIEVTDALGREQATWLVNEQGLYELIFRSNKPEAKRFREWVFAEVLPTIRKTGSYHAPTPSQPLLSHDRITLLKESFAFLQELGMADDRDRLMFADIIRTTTRREFLPQDAGQTGQLALPSPQGFFVAEQVQALGYALTRQQEATLLGRLAKQIAAEYRSRYGIEPSKAKRYVDGAVRSVNWYKSEEASWADVLIQRFFADFYNIQRMTAQPEEH